MNRKQKIILFLGIACVMLLAASSFHAVLFNDSRLVKPMDMSSYTFRMMDLPMHISVFFMLLYCFYLCALLIKTVIANKKNMAVSKFTRKINPKFGFCGFFGFFGFLGFWTYSKDGSIFPFMFFMFFGFFGFFFEGKMSDTFMDERYRANREKAELKAHRITITIIFLMLLLLGQGGFLGNLEYTLIAVISVTAFAIAADLFLCEYLLYRYDHDEASESGE